MITTERLFLSCDWGTSTFRLRAVAIPALNVLAEVTDNNGIAATYELWKQQNKDTSEQLGFYQNIIRQNIERLEQLLGFSLTAVPLILSGMASSNIGMKELSYKELPFSLDGSDLLINTLPATSTFQYDIILISGVRSADDVMRGEEIQIVGSVLDQTIPEQLFILPGTHSKHIVTKNNKAHSITTYMTGEVFHLLSTKSILASSVDKAGSFNDENNQHAFTDGIKDSSRFNVLHAAFLVRTNQLFQKLSKTQNYYYLSGLLVGLELNGSVNKSVSLITLISNKELKDLYVSALKQLGVSINLRIVNVDEAIVKGHYQVYLNHSVVRH